MTFAPAPFTTTSGPAGLAPRADLYGPIHKALRHCQGETLSRLGRVDTADAADLHAALEALEDLLVFNEVHLRHEEQFLHPAIDDRMPSAVLRGRREHLHHGAAVAALRAEARAVVDAPPAARAHRMHQLYLRLARFMADNLLHMDFEESVIGPALHSLHGEAELDALHQRLIDSLAPQEAMQAGRWMRAALPAR